MDLKEILWKLDPLPVDASWHVVWWVFEIFAWVAIIQLVALSLVILVRYLGKTSLDAHVVLRRFWNALVLNLLFLGFAISCFTFHYHGSLISHEPDDFSVGRSQLPWLAAYAGFYTFLYGTVLWTARVALGRDRKPGTMPSDRDDCQSMADSKSRSDGALR